MNPRQNLAGGIGGRIEQMIMAGAGKDAAGAKARLVLSPFVISGCGLISKDFRRKSEFHKIGVTGISSRRIVKSFLLRNSIGLLNGLAPHDSNEAKRPQVRLDSTSV